MTNGGTSPKLRLEQVRFSHPDVAELSDAAQEFYVELYGGPDSDAIDDAEFAPPRGAFFVGYVDDIPVAIGGWRFLADPGAAVAPRAAEIKRMYVVPAARRSGHARALLAALEKSAADAGADVLVLATGRPQGDAIALYRRSGYQATPPFGHYAGADGAVHLAKPLAAGDHL